MEGPGERTIHESATANASTLNVPICTVVLLGPQRSGKTALRHVILGTDPRNAIKLKCCPCSEDQEGLQEVDGFWRGQQEDKPIRVVEVRLVGNGKEEEFESAVTKLNERYTGPKVFLWTYDAARTRMSPAITEYLEILQRVIGRPRFLNSVRVVITRFSFSDEVEQRQLRVGALSYEDLVKDITSGVLHQEKLRTNSIKILSIDAFYNAAGPNPETAKFEAAMDDLLKFIETNTKGPNAQNEDTAMISPPNVSNEDALEDTDDDDQTSTEDDGINTATSMAPAEEKRFWTPIRSLIRDQLVIRFWNLLQSILNDIWGGSIGNILSLGIGLIALLLLSLLARTLTPYNIN